MSDKPELKPCQNMCCPYNTVKLFADPVPPSCATGADADECGDFTTTPTISITVAELEDLRDHKRLSIGKLKTQKGIIQALQEMNHDLKVKTKGYEKGTHALIGIAEHQTIQDRVADLAKPSEWVSVDDRLPEAGRYNVTLNSPVVRIARLTGAGKWYLRPTEDVSEYVTHWQPLPSPPDKE